MDQRATCNVQRPKRQRGQRASGTVGVARTRRGRRSAEGAAGRPCTPWYRGRDVSRVTPRRFDMRPDADIGHGLELYTPSGNT
eukprot:4886243-Prymnesium_polylepis.3